MRVPDWEEYLKQVFSYVKFEYDHNSIYFELSEHMEDRYEDFVMEGMDKEAAQKPVLTCMGDANAIGVELNKAHSPLIDWIWRSLKTVLISLIIANILPVFSLIGAYFISVFETYEKKNDNPLIYTMDVDDKEKTYDTTLMIHKILYYEDHTLEIRYATWTNPFTESIKWSSSIGMQVYDAQGQIYIEGHGWKSGSYYGRG